MEYAKLDTETVAIEVKYVRGSHARDSKKIDPDADPALFQLTRDLRAFGTAAFDEYGHDVQEALDTAYATIGTTEYPTEGLEDVEDLLRDVYDRCQGPRVVDDGLYDGRIHRSMSPGDLIVVDDMAYMVDRCGFAQIDTQEADR